MLFKFYFCFLGEEESELQRGCQASKQKKKKRKISKQVNVSKTQLQKELTVPKPLTGETDCINPSVFECVNFPKAYNWIKGYFVLQGKRRGLNEAGKENQKSAWPCQWEEHRLTPTPTCSKLVIWFHPQEPPTVEPDWNAAARTPQRCQHTSLHSHTESQIWLRRAKQKPQNTSGFFAFSSQVQSLFWVTWELYGCARTTSVYVCTVLKQGMWIHLVKTQLKPALPARDRFI